MDNYEIQRAIRNATDRAEDYNQFREHEPKRDYWEQKYYLMEKEMWRYRRQCWELRDRLHELQESIRQALKSSKYHIPKEGHE